MRCSTQSFTLLNYRRQKDVEILIPEGVTQYITPLRWYHFRQNCETGRCGCSWEFWVLPLAQSTLLAEKIACEAHTWYSSRLPGACGGQSTSFNDAEKELTVYARKGHLICALVGKRKYQTDPSRCCTEHEIPRFALLQDNIVDLSSRFANSPLSYRRFKPEESLWGKLMKWSWEQSWKWEVDRSRANGRIDDADFFWWDNGGDLEKSRTWCY